MYSAHRYIDCVQDTRDGSWLLDMYPHYLGYDPFKGDDNEPFF